GLAEGASQLRPVESDGGGGCALLAGSPSVQREHGASRDAANLPRSGEPDLVVEDRREAGELGDEVEGAVLEGQVGRAADLPLQCRIPLAGVGDPVFHQVDSVALSGAVFTEPVQEVAAAAADVEHAAPLELHV